MLRLRFPPHILFLSFTACLFALAETICMADDELVAKETDADLVLEHKTFQIVLRVNRDVGTYRISYRGREWLGEGLVVVRRGKQQAATKMATGVPSDLLHLTAKGVRRGEDIRGEFGEVSLQWKMDSDPPLIFETSFRIYRDTPAIFFTLDYTGDVDSLSHGKFTDTSSNFPVFAPTDEYGRELVPDVDGVFSYTYRAWPMPRFGTSLKKSLENWSPYAVLTPLVFWDSRGRAGVLSPLNHPLLDVTRAIDLEDWGYGRGIACGLTGHVDNVADSDRFTRVLVFGRGIFPTLRRWGDVQIAWWDRGRPQTGDLLALRTLGFQVEKQFVTPGPDDQGTSTADLLVRLRDDHRGHGVPAGYYVLGKWWFPADERNGMLAWTPQPELFPEGLPEFLKRFDVPLVFRTGYFGARSTFAKQYEGLQGKHYWFPVDSRFWYDFAARLALSGRCLYEQDNIDTQFFRMRRLRSQLGLAKKWLRDMAEAFAEQGICIAYGRPTIGAYLAAAALPSVVSAEACPPAGETDQEAIASWRQFVYGSVLAKELGIYPFRGVLPADQNDQNADERLADALLSILSCGPIIFRASPGHEDLNIIQRLCLADGTLLKPDVPLQPLERCLRFDPAEDSRAVILSTYASSGGLTCWYVLAMNLNAQGKVVLSTFSPEEVGLPRRCVVFDWRMGLTQMADPTTQVRTMLQPGEFKYYVLSPVDGYDRACFGDVSCFVSCSRQRVARYEASPRRIFISLRGVKEEFLDTRYWLPAQIVIHSPSRPLSVVAGGGQILGEQDPEHFADVTEGWCYEKDTRLITIRTAAARGRNIEVLFPEVEIEKQKAGPQPGVVMPGAPDKLPHSKE